MLYKKMDYNYCLIYSNFNNNISLFFFPTRNNFRIYPICITAKQAKNIYSLIILHSNFDNLSVSHCLYLGQELYKAELALFFKQSYVQD
uniref:Conserved hypothetical plastid protein n=1 Tax=Caulacanthus okamurae TaxID=152008 RepID=A0A6H1U8G5_9FLOR|nr:conserved hypothetical plastid protein [Caulacanthus okamurae]QIZ74736.1 conserved hypothetical plastid protein [Caulacanthus okamurae]